MVACRGTVERGVTVATLGVHSGHISVEGSPSLDPGVDNSVCHSVYPKSVTAPPQLTDSGPVASQGKRTPLERLAFLSLDRRGTKRCLLADPITTSVAKASHMESCVYLLDVTSCSGHRCP